MLIVPTDALARLVVAEPGCPTWPKCADDSSVTTPEVGVPGVGLVLGIVVGLVVLALVVVLARRRARRPKAPPAP